MMFDFDTPPSRVGTASYKWDSAGQADVIPLWVADMDFRTAPAIIEALEKRVQHGIFGYVRVPDEYYRAVIDWFSRRHGWKIEREQIIYTSGVVPAISAIIKAVCKPGDGVVVQTPVYNCFFSSIRNNGCRVVENPLLRTENPDGSFSYEMNFDELDDILTDSSNHLLLLCNPHNPAGRCWTAEELVRLSEICDRHGVTVVSDEIHCELTMPGYRFVPYAAVARSENWVICNSPSKAFNTAGLQIANIISPAAAMRAAIDRAININEVCDVNPFGVVGLMAAYTQGESWLEALLTYIQGNYDFFRRFMSDHLPALSCARLEATYLVWIDIRPLECSGEEIEENLRWHHGVWVNAGGMYGCDDYVRVNLACPRARLAEGLRRMAEGINNRLSTGSWHR